MQNNNRDFYKKKRRTLTMENLTNNEINLNINQTEKQDEIPLSMEKDKAEDSFFGKFKTKESMIKSYQTLEQELTKRATKLKELEKVLEEKEVNDKMDKKISNFLKAYPVANNYLNEIEEEFSKDVNLFEDENCLEKALLKILCNAKGQPQKETIKVGELLSLRQPNPSIATHSELPSFLPNRPKTLKEAKKLAIDLISK